MPPLPRKIIIDTDPGQDDAIAILMALGNPQALEVLGLSVVAGNIGLENTSRNARRVCELAKRPDIPIFAGCPGPMMRPLQTAEHVHGKTGLDGVDLPPPTMPLQPLHAVDFLIDTLRMHPSQSISLCTLGPLTNIATALIKAPDIAPRIQEIVMMGGSRVEGGNISPAAEFNIYVDPEAAHIVFGAGIPITVLPLDVTHQVLTSKARVHKIAALDTDIARAVVGWITFYERYYIARTGLDGAPLHDPCTIGWMLRPELFSGRRVNVQIETHSSLTRGMSVVDWWGVNGAAPNALFLNQVDADGFFAELQSALERLG